MSAIEVLKKDLASYEGLRETGKRCTTLNNEECCFVHYPEIREAVLALEQKEKLKKWLEVEIKKSEKELKHIQTMFCFDTTIPPNDFSEGKMTILKDVREML